MQHSINVCFMKINVVKLSLLIENSKFQKNQFKRFITTERCV